MTNTRRTRVVMVTTMEELPESCLQCLLNEYCNLPINRRDFITVNKPYRNKRHENCPLRKVDM